MTPTLHHYYLARITLEAVTPLSIATGKDDGVFDVTLAQEANGLPTLPGSAIAGVLRHLFWELHGKDKMEAVFGFQKGEKGGASRLHVSWGCIQDSKGEPVEGLLLNGVTDDLLKSALVTQDIPTHRERVRINHRGAATHQGKFDRTVLLAGHRFSAEIALWSDQADDSHWEQILALLQHPLFRLGGGTRAGLGRLKLVRAHTGHFDLKAANGREAFRNISRSISKTNGLTILQPKTPTDQIHSQFITATINLKPRSFWRIGQGDAPQLFADEKPADMLPKLEPRVRWNKSKVGAIVGAIGPAQLLIPATSLKGALSHRVAFHANRLAGRWATEQSLNNDEEYSKESCDEIKNLFGFISDKKGQVGHVLFDDSFIEFDKKDLGLMMHNAIDRFTGGVREHMLFMEELVWKKPIEIACTIDTRGITDQARHALRLALKDLCEGRLSLGGGAGKGHGFFDGSVSWSDNGTWINSSTSAPVPVLDSSTSKAA